MRQGIGPRDIDTAMNGCNPGGAGKGAYDTGRTENRNAAFDAETGVPCLQRDLRAIGNRNLDLDIPRPAERLRQIGNGALHHLARHRVDRRLAGRDRQAGLCHRADPLAAPKGHA